MEDDSDFEELIEFLSGKRSLSSVNQTWREFLEECGVEYVPPDKFIVLMKRWLRDPQNLMSVIANPQTGSDTEDSGGEEPETKRQKTKACIVTDVGFRLV